MGKKSKKVVGAVGVKGYVIEKAVTVKHLVIANHFSKEEALMMIMRQEQKEGLRGEDMHPIPGVNIKHIVIDFGPVEKMSKKYDIVAQEGVPA